MALTDTEIRAIKPGAKPFKKFDGGGLFLLVNPNGSRLWRLKYIFEGKERLLTLGSYPEISLRLARIRQQEAKSLIAQGLDPNSEKRRKKTEAIQTAKKNENTFKKIALEWYATNCAKWQEKYARQIMQRMGRHIFPYLGDKPLMEIRRVDFMQLLKRIENADNLEMARRIAQILGQVSRYAIDLGLIEYDFAIANNY